MPRRTRHRQAPSQRAANNNNNNNPAQQQRTSSSSIVGVGKGRTAAKQAIYAQPLPVQVHVHRDAATANGASQKGKQKATATARQGWADYLWSWLPSPATAASTSKRTPHAATPSPLGRVRGHWDPLSSTVWLPVTPRPRARAGADAATDDEAPLLVRGQSAAVRTLWEKGFFGKGTLSRSEPTWRARRINEAHVERQRQRGNTNVFTPEELIAQRRAVRKAAKIERARLAVKAGQQLPDGIVALGGVLTPEEERAIERAAERELQQEDDEKRQAQGGGGAAGEEDDDDQTEEMYGKHIPGLIYLGPNAQPLPSNQDARRPEGVEPASTVVVEQRPALPGAPEGFNPADEGDDEEIDVEDMETLQLMPCEVLFLAGMLDVLDVLDDEGQPIPLERLYALLLASSLPPHLLAPSPFVPHPQFHLDATRSLWARPDNPFLLHYVAYHHYRSLGWVVKGGVKFCVDLLLYKKGPAFSHAEFAVVVIPEYEEPSDAASPSPFGAHPNSQPRDWVWFSAVNRVNTQVFKTLILCYVTVPSLARLRDTPDGPVNAPPSARSDLPHAPPAPPPSSSYSLRDPRHFVEALRHGRSFGVREVAVRRWVPARMRP